MSKIYFQYYQMKALNISMFHLHFAKFHLISNAFDFYGSNYKQSIKNHPGSFYFFIKEFMKRQKLKYYKFYLSNEYRKDGDETYRDLILEFKTNEQGKNIMKCKCKNEMTCIYSPYQDRHVYQCKYCGFVCVWSSLDDIKWHKPYFDVEVETIFNIIKK